MSNNKTNVSAYVDEEVADYLKQDHVNASGLINDLVKKHMNGDSEDVLREFRRQQLIEEAKDLKNRAERKEEEAEKLAEVNEQQEEERRDELETVAEELVEAQVPLEADNPAVKNNASEIGVEPEELVEKAREERGGTL
jgi:hypothetical protein